MKTETQNEHEQIERNMALLDGVWTCERYRDLLARFFGFYAPLEPILWSQNAWNRDNFQPHERQKTQFLQRDLQFLGLTNSQIDALPRSDFAHELLPSDSTKPKVSLTISPETNELETISNGADLRAANSGNSDLQPLNSRERLAFARALGCAYVLEGSTLGGQLLARHFKRVLEIDERGGLEFFVAYGVQTGAKWNEFRAFLNSAVAQNDVQISIEQNANSATENQNFADAQSEILVRERELFADEIVRAARQTFVAFDKWLHS